MKYIWITFLCCVFMLEVAFAQGHQSVTKVDIDYRLVKAINDYVNEFSDTFDQTKAAIVIRFDKTGNTDKFYLAFKVYRSEVINDPPSFYSVANKKLILLYTGIEQYLKFDKNSLEKLFADSKDSLTVTGMTYDPIVWEIQLVKDSYDKKVVELLPW